ncbi:hypothetical protein LF63_0109055 [Oleiagrimonas soli]|nr:hypothetical protein LF63_0109055 [Oleiagrimonas soli]
MLPTTQATVSTPAVESGRHVRPLMTHWRFRYTGHPGDAHTLAGAAFDDRGWQRVTLPHTWNHFGEYTTHRTAGIDMRQGVGWYRLHLPGAQLPPGARHYLQFDAVGNVADVWVNGRHVGHHAGAFSRFRIDVTGLLHHHADNVIAVRADNSKPAPGSRTEHVIPLSGDFFIHGGLYRGVSLIGVGEQHVDLMDFGGPGVYLTTPDVDDAQATLRVRSRLRNDANRARQVDVRAVVRDAQGRIVASASESARLPAQATTVRTTTLTLPHPHRWDGRRDPYLYRVTLTLSEHGRILDRVSQPLGVRTMRIDPDRGFFLNGRHLALHGVSRHQDRMGKGWAVSRADEDQDMALIEDIGANTIRMAHYQQSPHWFQLADRAGMVVWAEAPLVNAVSLNDSPADPALIANARQQLTELIRQNMNHPSVAVWGIGNETDLLMATGQLGAKADPVPVLRDLQKLAHRLDPTRPTTLADCCEEVAPKKVLPDVTGISDAIGYNRYFGWYYGQVSDLGPYLDTMHARHPRQPIAVSELGAGGAVSQHTDNPLGGPIDTEGRPHPEAFETWWHEKTWPQIARRPFVWAAWVWNMFDFSSPIRHSGDSTDINDKGLVTFDRKIRKDAFYYYQAQWSSQPVVHITQHRYVHRDYAFADVHVFANAPAVDLRLNGRDLGTVPCRNKVCVRRNVQLSPGANMLRASARFGNRTVTDRVRWIAPDARDGVGINVGDLAGFVDGQGFRYGSDDAFIGGTPHRFSDKQQKRSHGDAPVAMRAGYREGRFGYAIPLPNGLWRVTLTFVDPGTGKHAPRSFDVRADGHTLLSAFEPARAAGGTLRSVTRSFVVRSSHGRLHLQFVPRTGPAVLSGIRIRPVHSPRRT